MGRLLVSCLPLRLYAWYGKYEDACVADTDFQVSQLGATSPVWVSHPQIFKQPMGRLVGEWQRSRITFYIQSQTKDVSKCFFVVRTAAVLSCETNPRFSQNDATRTFLAAE